MQKTLKYFKIKNDEIVPARATLLIRGGGMGGLYELLLYF